jgi:hypothetical protein
LLAVRRDWIRRIGWSLVVSVPSKRQHSFLISSTPFTICYHVRGEMPHALLILFLCSRVLITSMLSLFSSRPPHAAGACKLQ